ncbi:RloB family protein [bacterium]|nr:RloB family protein [bacterium]
MAPDQLHHKWRIKKEEELVRREAVRAVYDIILIVCEGETEREYFKFIRKHLNLSSRYMKISEDEHGSDPMSVVNHAIAKLEKDPDYDRVYCVMDRDKHTTFNDAMRKIRDSKFTNKLIPVVSVPCFEFWMLLHFKYTTKPFCTAGQASNCRKVIHELHKHMPEYQKAKKENFAAIWDKRDKAIKGAKQISKYHETSGTDNPSSDMYKVVEDLEKMSK